MSARLAYGGIALAALLLALGCIAGGRWFLAPAPLLLEAAWALRQRRGDRWASPAGLGLTVAAAAAGLWLGLGGLWMLGAVGAALAAWDLDQFEQHLRQAGQVQGREELERRHLRRLGLALGLGLPLGAVALQVQVRFSFFAALLLAGLATLGIGELVLYLRQGR